MIHHHHEHLHRLAEIEVEDVGWSILDTALSPDRNSVAYSTWSDCSKFKSNQINEIYFLIFYLVYLVKLNENQCQPNIVPLYLQPHIT